MKYWAHGWNQQPTTEWVESQQKLNANEFLVQTTMTTKIENGLSENQLVQRPDRKWKQPREEKRHNKNTTNNGV